jgi:hypothetical protein
LKQDYITGHILNSDVEIPQVSTELKIRDFLGAVRVRWGIGRDNYRIIPGIYAIGSPGSSSDVFVTANYKLSFDTVRKNLSGINGWILVLDTKGINVWCAAGKGTFGSKELIDRIYSVSLNKIVNHKRIILPQLGATGVAAHKVKEGTGFNVHYGPVRASDIKGFVDAGYRATKEMRKVTFNLLDRAKLIPNDFMYGKFYLLAAFALVFVISFLGNSESSLTDHIRTGLLLVGNVFIGYCAGIIITPLLLPWLPGRQFSFKGFYSGVVVSTILFLFRMTGVNIFEIVAWFLIIPAISSFMAMNFTGSSTFTSLSGVKKEMKLAIPLQIVFSAFGIILLVISRLIK